MKIPIIDIFAGPGGLGEGFSAFVNPENHKRQFKIALSIEKDTYAHQTLKLRSFFRQFAPEQVPLEYYECIKERITLSELYVRWPLQAKKANAEALLAELGEGKEAVSNSIVDKKIQSALNKEKDWVLIGGPPCQAYSVVGRSRRREKVLDEKKDERVALYKQYLRILGVHKPAVFVMENVKGLLSAKTLRSPLFSKILADLSAPGSAYLSDCKNKDIKLNSPGYRIYSLVAEPTDFDSKGNPIFCPQDFVIRSEKFGVPQTRHRVILLGIRKDIEFSPKTLKPSSEVSISSVLSDLPEIRSRLSKTADNNLAWKSAINDILEKGILVDIDKSVKEEILKQLNKISASEKKPGGEYLTYKQTSTPYYPEWYLDPRIEGVCNHSSRGHMKSDLTRYLFASCFAKVKKRSPKLEDFPQALLPAHKNINDGIENKKFADRFRVQLWNKPCKTVTSHISKDGHYYIHPDPAQCRSFTVREAARIQTFPDNYYFCGPRTSQFVQVGNAVPPLLANQIAEIVFEIFKSIYAKRFVKETYQIPELVK
ncbi:DNA cytosine methyltransferase [Flexistipes sp.]|uniref:DNA cytosine methyltransferase n=1 Tax=Flexistipes sp. TaxID=3088135 RepID=UPI002E1A7A49|nr:DNA cytosine methyltransferase [Flexistipes sp.]